MARPQKSTVDYFPHATEHGKTMFILESKWGNDGYATWFKILEKLGSSDHHIINLNDPAEAEYLAAFCRVTVETLFAILDVCSAVNAIHRGFWRRKLVYSENFVKNVSDAYRKRLEKLPTEELIETLYPEFPAEETGKPAEETPQNDVSGDRNGERERERERKDIETTSLVGQPADGKPKHPNCPHQEIVTAYNDTLGHLLPPARMSLWPNSAGAANLQARWKENEKRQRIEFWEGLFEYIRDECPFLIGQGGSNGGKPWKADLRWIVKRENLIKIQEGRYAKQ